MRYEVYFVDNDGIEELVGIFKYKTDAENFQDTLEETYTKDCSRMFKVEKEFK